MDSFFSRKFENDIVSDDPIKVSTIWAPGAYETCVSKGETSEIVWVGDQCRYDDSHHISIAQKAHTEEVSKQLMVLVRRMFSEALEGMPREVTNASD